jgi:hypothetical protein
LIDIKLSFLVNKRKINMAKKRRITHVSNFENDSHHNKKYSTYRSFSLTEAFVSRGKHVYIYSAIKALPIFFMPIL